MCAILALMAGLAVGSKPATAAQDTSGDPVALTVDPTSVAPGQSTSATVELRNPGDRRVDASANLSLPAGMSLGSATGAPGWSLEYSEDGGTTWSATAPQDFAAITNVRTAGSLEAGGAGEQRPLDPLTAVGALQVSGGGDGYGALFHQDELWLVNHHARAVDKPEPPIVRPGGEWLKCFNRIDASPCPAPYPGADGTFISEVAGTPFGQGTSTLVTPNASVAAIDQATGRLYAPAQVHAENGRTAVGWICGELTTMTSCGFTPAGEEDAPEDFGGKNIFPRFNPAQSWQPSASANLLYAVGGSGTIYCFDAPAGQLCPDNGVRSVPTALPTTTMRFVYTAVAGESQAAPKPRYVYTVSMPDDSTGLLQCRDLLTGAGCGPNADTITLTSPGAPGDPATFSQPVTMFSTTGAFEGVCVFGQSMFTAGSWTCVTPTGAPLDTYETALDGATPDQSAHFGGRIQPYGSQGPFTEQSLMVYAKQLGTKLFLPWVKYPDSTKSEGAQNSITCFDFATSATCAGFSPPSAGYDDNVVYTVDQPSDLPGCVWWSGDRGRLQAFSAESGALGCDPVSLTTVDVTPSSCAPLDDSHYDLLSLPGLPSGVTARVSLYDTAGALLSVGSDGVLAAGETLDLSSIPISGATSTLRAVVAVTSDPSVVDLADANVRISWQAPLAAMCLELTPTPDCTAGSTPELTVMATFTPSAGGSATQYNARATLAVQRGEGDCTLTLVKQINGQIATEPPGVTVPVGAPLDYRFEVSTPGAFSLGTPVLIDDATTPDSSEDDFSPEYVDGDSNGNKRLDPGETWTYRHPGTAEREGTFTNIARVTAPGATNPPVQARAVHTAKVPGISVTKTTNGIAATGPGLELVPGDEVRWAYTVTNVGPVTLSEIAATDDPAGTPECPAAELAPGESMTCELTGTSVAGDYSNTVTVTGTDRTTGAKVTGTDRNQYVGLTPEVRIVKTINGAGTADPDGTARRVPLTIGQTAEVAFEVTNTGTANLVDVAVTDAPLSPGDQPLAVSCPATTLAIAESMTCTAVTTAVAGDHDDRATVSATGTFRDGTPLRYSDGRPVPPVTASSQAGYTATDGPPGQPGQPGAPGQPGQPGPPGQAGDSGTSPAAPAATSSKLAQTGANLMRILGLGLLAVGSGVALYRFAAARR